jgi:hypothetical protein
MGCLLAQQLLAAGGLVLDVRPGRVRGSGCWPPVT